MSRDRISKGWVYRKNMEGGILQHMVCYFSTVSGSNIIFVE